MVVSYKEFNAKMIERQEKQLADRYKFQKERVFQLYSSYKNIDELLTFPHP